MGLWTHIEFALPTKALQHGLRSADASPMLVCRACNTRFEAGMSHCPSCGRRAADHATDADSSRGEANPLPLRTRVTDPDADIDFELEDAVLKTSTRTAEKATPRLRSMGSAPSAPGLSADAAQVRAALAERPALLEKDLGLHADDDGEPLGIDFPTPVGSIDVLARDRKGGYVVVHVPSPEEVPDSVSGMLRRMGWVRKHLASESEVVRGVVVIDHLPEDLSYAAAGAGGSIAFKGYRFALTFHDLDL